MRIPTQGHSDLDNPIWGLDWPEVRALWSLDPSRAHLNHGSFGAVPIPVQRAQDELRGRVEANPMEKLSRTLKGELDEARAVASRFLGGDVEGFAFVPNVTTAVNSVLASAPLHTGDEVLITDQAYGAVRFAAERICAAKGVKVVVTPVPLPKRQSGELVKAVVAGVTPETRLALVDHIASPTGLVFPITELVTELHRRGVLVLVDAAHAPGMVHVDLETLNADFWTGNFHKWCCSPRGSAGLWVQEDHRKTVAPIITSWYLNEGYPCSFRWLGTDDYTPYLAVPAALEFMDNLGWERVRNHNRNLARVGREVVRAALGTDPATSPELDHLFEAMTLVRLPEGVVATEEDARALQILIAKKLNTETSPIAWNGSGYLRLSAQVYNAPAEYERLAAGLPHLLEAQRS